MIAHAQACCSVGENFTTEVSVVGLPVQSRLLRTLASSRARDGHPSRLLNKKSVHEIHSLSLDR